MTGRLLVAQASGDSPDWPCRATGARSTSHDGTGCATWPIWGRVDAVPIGLRQGPCDQLPLVIRRQGNSRHKKAAPKGAASVSVGLAGLLGGLAGLCGLLAGAVVKNALAQAEALGRHLQQFVGSDVLDRSLQG